MILGQPLLWPLVEQKPRDDESKQRCIYKGPLLSPCFLSLEQALMTIARAMVSCKLRLDDQGHTLGIFIRAYGERSREDDHIDGYRAGLGADEEVPQTHAVSGAFYSRGGMFAAQAKQ